MYFYRITRQEEKKQDSSHLFFLLWVLNRKRLVCVAQEVFSVLRARLACIPARKSCFSEKQKSFFLPVNGYIHL